MIEHRFFDAGEVRLHVAEAGQGTPVVLLHGFPEGWRSWRAQMEALASAGFRAVAPDLRGYGESDRPRGASHYKVSRIADDVAALIHSLDPRPVCVIGHDWGAPIAYRVAMDYPDLVSRLIILNGPHLAHFQHVLRTSAAQRRRSWYIFFFQLPRLPELGLRRPGSLRKIFRGAAPEDVVVQYEQDFARPGAAEAAINWYRAAGRRDRPARQRIVDKDVLVIWGMRDAALGPECLEGLEKWAPRVRVIRLPDAGHFVQQEAAEEVNAILLRELRESGEARPAAWNRST
jgi:pimeloyl-ACP methyl ester carboxylesterase